nr:MAG TPA_asm: hypothetical protein [Caudoviricetes sp.]
MTMTSERIESKSGIFHFTLSDMVEKSPRKCKTA